MTENSFPISRYMFDEPSSYLDVKQRLNAARMIRALLDAHTYVIAVEHDLSVLDYLSDFICCLYGVPSVYGVVTVPSPVRDGESFFPFLRACQDWISERILPLSSFDRIQVSTFS